MNSEFTVGGSTSLDGTKSLFCSTITFYECRGKCFRAMENSFQVGWTDARNIFSNQSFCFRGKIFFRLCKVESGVREDV